MVISAKDAEWEPIIISEKAGWKEGEGGPRQGAQNKAVIAKLCFLR